MTTQIALKVPDDLVAAVDQLVASGRFESRSDAIRFGIGLAVGQARRDEIDHAFIEGYRRNPQTDEELADAKRLAIASIEDEPWEPWW